MSSDDKSSNLSGQNLKEKDIKNQRKQRGTWNKIKKAFGLGS